MLDLDPIPDQVSPGTRKALHLLDQLADDDEPVTITINGKIDLVITDDDDSFRMLVALVNRLELLKYLKQARKELDEGKGLSLEKVKEQARVKYGITL